MSEKFQAEMKELDKKFAAIPENLKKRYDKHRLIRCSSMVFLALLFGITSVASQLISYVGYSDARASFVLCGGSFIHLLDGILFKVLQDKKIQQLFHKKSRCQFDDFYF